MSTPKYLKVREIISKYKTKKCAKDPVECKFHTFLQKDVGEIVGLCTSYHNEADARRNPFADKTSKKLNYLNELCEEFNPITNCCPHKSCSKCRNLFELYFHPSNFKQVSC